MCTSEQDRSGDGIIGIVRCSPRARNMRRLAADLSLVEFIQVNAVRATFKAGITPSRIAPQFGISQSNVRKALASGEPNR